MKIWIIAQVFASLCNRRPRAHSDRIITMYSGIGVGQPTRIDTLRAWRRHECLRHECIYAACSAITCSISNRSLLVSLISAAPIIPSTC